MIVLLRDRPGSQRGILLVYRESKELGYAFATDPFFLEVFIGNMLHHVNLEGLFIQVYGDTYLPVTAMVSDRVNQYQPVALYLVSHKDNSIIEQIA